MVYEEPGNLPIDTCNSGRITLGMRWCSRLFIISRLELEVVRMCGRMTGYIWVWHAQV